MLRKQNVAEQKKKQKRIIIMDFPHIEPGSYYERISFAVAGHIFADELHLRSLM